MKLSIEGSKLDMKEKVALVTGGSSGIGKATVLAFVARGAKVVIADIDDSASKEIISMVKNQGGEAHFVKTDVSDPEQAKAMVTETLDVFGRLDYACNNAGIGGEQNLTADYSVEGWQAVININLSGVFYGMKYQIPAMLKTGGGAIVNMASILGKVAFASSPAYVAAKHGVVGISKTAAIEYGQQNIRVNAVGPGFIKTPLISELEEDPDTYNMLVSLHPIGRLGESEEVANLVVWLSSEEASFLTGSFIPVDGGYLAR